MNPNNLKPNGTPQQNTVKVSPQLAMALILLDHVIHGVQSGAMLMREGCGQPEVARALAAIQEHLIGLKGAMLKEAEQRIQVVPAGALPKVNLT